MLDLRLPGTEEHSGDQKRNQRETFRVTWTARGGGFIRGWGEGAFLNDSRRVLGAVQSHLRLRLERGRGNIVWVRIGKDHTGDAAAYV